MKRKLITVILALVVVLAMVPVMMTTASAADGYSGTPATPAVIDGTNFAQFGLTSETWSVYNGYYAITTAEELYGFAAIVNKSDRSGTGACAILVNDIVVNTGTVTSAGSSSGTSHEWTPIARDYNNDYNYYMGTFDGRGHTISGLYASDATAKPIGLFGAVGQQFASTAVIKNVTIANSYLTAGGSLGTIVGYANGPTEILNCKVASDVVLESATTNLGGILGGFSPSGSSNASVENCVFLGSLVASTWRNVGSISGKAVDITNCYYINRGILGVGSGTDYAKDVGTIGIASTSAEHTCVGMTHPEVPSTCTTQGSSAYTDCMICGTVMSGTKGSLPLAHNWQPATCAAPKTCVTCKTTEGETADHNYYYTADGAVVTEACLGGCTHSETATLAFSSATSSTYTSKEVEPLMVVYTAGWKGGTLPIVYENNVNASHDAKGSITKDNAVATLTFVIFPASISDVTVTLDSDRYPYTAEAVEPIPTVKLGENVLPESDYTVTYSNNLDVGATATVTVKAASANLTGTESATATFTITKGSLVPKGDVTASVAFGGDYKDAPISGTVVVAGTTTEISGSWAWTDGEMQATFTPDAAYGGLFDPLAAQTVNVTVVPVSPAITVSTSYESVIAGQLVNVLVSVEHPTNPAITDLPTDITIYYVVEENGSPVKVDGTSFVVPEGLKSGSIICIYAASEAVQGKYSMGASDTILVTVKTVQEVLDEAMSGLDDLRAELLALIEQKADLALLSDKVAELNQKILDAEEAAKLYAEEQDAALEERLTDAIEKAEEAAVTAAGAALDRAKAELKALIDENTSKIASNTEEITKQVALLNEAITNAETAAKRYADSQDEAQYERITGDIATAKQEAIEAAQAALDAVEARLQSLITANAENIAKNADEIAKQVGILTDMIALAEETAKQYADDMDDALYATVTEDIATAKSEAVDAAQAALDAVEEALRELIAEGDRANADEIVRQVNILTEMIALAEETAKDYADEMDAVLKKDVYTKIENAKNYAMQAAEAALKEARKDLTVLIEQGDKTAADELSAATDTLNAAINAAEKAASDADAAQKASLEDSISAARKEAADADAALKALLEGEIERAKQEAIDAAQAELDAAVKSLNTAVTVLSIVAGLALVGVAVLAILYFVPKKKV